ncbi:hypothetical protein, variant [Exophiala mesophila]|uniref:Zn(2)-C6 fungal-type domain-containing protein n=1 Tax=Exophiala mesophila TaxID=212818 RepID=A0A0D1WID2_EXOME|nr:hypothetical protein, variant [Exophiala mesophila]KIV88575.1 hypothetical protein, variant [Exophiala mesophila]
MAAAPSVKRRRVARACESCRSLKAKCDGVQPICGRCAGYGYECFWHQANRPSHPSLASGNALSCISTDANSQRMSDALKVYDDLIIHLRDKLSPDDRKLVDLRLATIQRPHHGAGQADNTIEDPTPSSPVQSSTSQRYSRHVERYLGEASDIRFYHILQSAFGPPPGADVNESGVSEPPVNSYEQEKIWPAPADKKLDSLPSRQTADSLVDIYFSTIHKAYPFLSEPDFMAFYGRFWQSESLDEIRGPGLSTIFSIFAIGSCYKRVAESENGHASDSWSSRQDVLYFELALAIMQNQAQTRTVDHVCALLIQCFYLLATCQTDKSWITLGLAIRIAQSIGLHVEEAYGTSYGDVPGPAPSETRRRVWYSLFVLDRLLAMQLGRPPSIISDGFNVHLPSRQSLLDLAEQPIPPGTKSQDWGGDYFIAMIRFSEMIGRVFTDLYGPNKIDDAASVLSKTELLDAELIRWRSSLPRSLRFDLSHTFESSKTFQTQRNMLAVKFYNLQALVHRPMLSSTLSATSRQNTVEISRAEQYRVSLSKRRCIVAAQCTAKLLYNLKDKRSLVYDFPWWQMISCLICASSILLVASICVDHNSGTELEVFSDVDWLVVNEDAEVCLQTFQALSSNSNAARLARDMMQRLKNTRMMSCGTMGAYASTAPGAATENGIENVEAPVTSIGDLPVSQMPQLDFETLNQETFDHLFQVAPYEFSEPVTCEYSLLPFA